MQNNRGNFSNVAFLPYARFFAGQRSKGGMAKWPNGKYASALSSTTEPRNAGDKCSHGPVQPSNQTQIAKTSYSIPDADSSMSSNTRTNTVRHTKYTSPALDILSELPSISVLLPYSLYDFLLIST